MIFATEHAIENILAGKKTQTRRLVKEEDYLAQYVRLNSNKLSDFCIVDAITSKKVKCYVGQDLSVQSGRGKPCVCYCPKCNESLIPVKENNEYARINLCGIHHEAIRKLRIRITSIRKEKVLDISEEDAKKEGFENRAEFIKAFMGINSMGHILAKAYNHPDVWCLEFSVV